MTGYLEGMGLAVAVALYLLIIGTACSAYGDNHFREEKKGCPSGCETHGTCNEEFGRCECPFGFGGPDCSTPLLPACMSAVRPGAVPQYGVRFAKNCYCYRQLQRLTCKGEYWKDPFVCGQQAFWMWEDMRCYEFRDLPEEQQLSDPPEDPSGAKVVWRKGVRKRDIEGPESFDFAVDLAAPFLPGGAVLPVSKCKDRCNDRGRCVQRGEGPGCVCAPFYTGEACEAADASHCPLGCSGRGACKGGFCHCERGYWGAGCSRSRAYTADEWTPHPTELKVYVYDLPEEVSYMRPDNDDWPLHFPIYLAEIELYHQLLADKLRRTENPWEANLFFVPTHTYYYIGNVGFPGVHFGNVFRHVREQYPWWNMTAGRNHVVATSNDRGCCDLYRLGQDVQHPIKLTHFAQAPRHSMLSSKWGGTGLEVSERPEHLAARLRTNMEDPAMLGAIAELEHLAGRPRFRGFPLYELPALQQEREVCYRPEHDVAFPPYLAAYKDAGAWLEVLPRAYSTGPDGRAVFRRDHSRDTLLYFNGYTKTDMAYSAGVRQGLLALFKDSSRTDLNINREGGVNATLRSRFCFTPMGFGWGIRLSQAMYAGCVPVMTHDHTWPTLWDVLPYERFSVRVSRHNLHRLLDFLDAITPEQLARLQDGLAEFHKAFVWQAEAGGEAYKYTMLSLHRRLLNMWTAIF